MNILDKFILKFSNYFLKRKLRKFSRNRELKNLMHCNSIFILSSTLDDVNGDETARMIKYLKQLDKEVFSLMYTVESKNEIIPQVSEIKIFNHSHLNKIFIPKDPDIHLLMNKEFDLLIDLTLQESFALKYIHALSKAKLKVGAAMNYKRTFGDITFDISNNQTIPFLIVQIKHYLTQINQDKHVA